MWLSSETNWVEYGKQTFSLEPKVLGWATIRRDRTGPWRLNVWWAAGRRKDGDCTSLERLHDELDQAKAEGREYLQAGPMPESERPNRGPKFPPRRRPESKALMVDSGPNGRVLVLPIADEKGGCRYVIYWTGGDTYGSRLRFRDPNRALRVGLEHLAAGRESEPPTAGKKPEGA